MGGSFFVASLRKHLSPPSLSPLSSLTPVIHIFLRRYRAKRKRVQILVRYKNVMIHGETFGNGQHPFREARDTGKKRCPLDPTRGSGAQLFLRARARFQAKDDLQIGPRIVQALSSIASKNLVLRENNRLR